MFVKDFNVNKFKEKEEEKKLKREDIVSASKDLEIDVEGISRTLYKGREDIDKLQKEYRKIMNELEEDNEKNPRSKQVFSILNEYINKYAPYEEIDNKDNTFSDFATYVQKKLKEKYNVDVTKDEARSDIGHIVNLLVAKQNVSLKLLSKDPDGLIVNRSLRGYDERNDDKPGVLSSDTFEQYYLPLLINNSNLKTGDISNLVLTTKNEPFVSYLPIDAVKKSDDIKKRYNRYRSLSNNVFYFLFKEYLSNNKIINNKYENSIIKNFFENNGKLAQNVYEIKKGKEGEVDKSLLNKNYIFTPQGRRDLENALERGKTLGFIPLNVEITDTGYLTNLSGGFIKQNVYSYLNNKLANAYLSRVTPFSLLKINPIKVITEKGKEEKLWPILEKIKENTPSENDFPSPLPGTKIIFKDKNNRLGFTVEDIIAPDQNENTKYEYQDFLTRVNPPSTADRDPKEIADIFKLSKQRSLFLAEKNKLQILLSSTEEESEKQSIKDAIDKIDKALTDIYEITNSKHSNMRDIPEMVRSLSAVYGVPLYNFSEYGKKGRDDEHNRRTIVKNTLKVMSPSDVKENIIRTSPSLEERYRVLHNERRVKKSYQQKPTPYWDLYYTMRSGRVPGFGSILQDSNLISKISGNRNERDKAIEEHIEPKFDMNKLEEEYLRQNGVNRDNRYQYEIENLGNHSFRFRKKLTSIKNLSAFAQNYATKNNLSSPNEVPDEEIKKEAKKYIEELSPNEQKKYEWQEVNFDAPQMEGFVRKVLNINPTPQKGEAIINGELYQSDFNIIGNYLRARLKRARDFLATLSVYKPLPIEENEAPSLTKEQINKLTPPQMVSKFTGKKSATPEEKEKIEKINKGREVNLVRLNRAYNHELGKIEDFITKSSRQSYDGTVNLSNAGTNEAEAAPTFFNKMLSFCMSKEMITYGLGIDQNGVANRQYRNENRSKYANEFQSIFSGFAGEGRDSISKSLREYIDNGRKEMEGEFDKDDQDIVSRENYEYQNAVNNNLPDEFGDSIDEVENIFTFKKHPHCHRHHHEEPHYEEGDDLYMTIEGESYSPDEANSILEESELGELLPPRYTINIKSEDNGGVIRTYSFKNFEELEKLFPEICKDIFGDKLSLDDAIDKYKNNSSFSDSVSKKGYRKGENNIEVLDFNTFKIDLHPTK